MDISGTDCALARESVSADLDGELSELDFRRLQAHLRVCADCSAWAGHVNATTTQLREAPLETLAAPVFEVQRRSRTWRVGPAFALAPAAALVASVVVFLGGTQHGSIGPRTTSTPVSPTDLQGTAGQHRMFHAV
jgi:predicted anti-sigma-YlaC factor YlaD